MARKLIVEIIGDSSSLESAFDRSSKSAQGFQQEMQGAGRASDLLRVRASRATSIGLLRLAGAGVAAGLGIAAATRAIGAAADAIKVSGNAATTTSGRIQNLVSAITSGDLVGAFKALRNETYEFSQAQTLVIAKNPKLIAQLEQMGHAGDIAAAGLRATAEATVVPPQLELGAARAALRPGREDDIAALEAQIAGTRKAEAQVNRLRGITKDEAASDAALVVILRQRKELEDRIDALQAAGAKERRAKAQRAAEARAKAWNVIIKGMSLKALKAQLTASVKDDIAATDDLIRAIERQIAKEGKTFDLVEQLTQARIQRSGLVAQQRAATQAAREQAEAARAQAARDRAQAARDAMQRQIDVLELAVSKAGLTTKTTDDLKALRRELSVLDSLVAKHKNDLDLQQRQVDVRMQILDLTRQQHEEEKQALQEAKSNAQSLFGTLFAAQEKAEEAMKTFLGGTRGRRLITPAGTTVDALKQNIEAQLKAFRELQRNIAVLSRRGAPAELIREIRAGQISPDIAATLARAPAGKLKQIFRDVRIAERMVAQAARMDVKAQTVVVEAGQVHVSGIVHGRGTDETETHLNRRAKQRAPQRRGRSGGQR